MALPITVGASVFVRHCAGQAPSPATVSAVDPIRQLVTVTYTSGALVPQPPCQIAMSMCRLQSDPYQQSVPTGTIWDL
jgi:hypothetical protein